MPNIEIYGCSKTSPKAFRLRGEIEKQIQAIGLGNEAVVTIIFDSVVRSCDGERTSMPFIRVCSTNLAEIVIILEAFEKAKIGFDVETLVLNSFIPKDKME